MNFYLGVHHPSWIYGQGRWLRSQPMFVSYRTMRGRRTLAPADRSWALDSGGYTELRKYGTWTISPADYAADVARYTDQIGGLDWAAIQDWMCEDDALRTTGLTVTDHQSLTIQSLLDLRTISPHLPWTPVLQGRTADDYRRHRDAYTAAGIDLTAEPVVGLGSVCRRQSTQSVHDLIRELAVDGIRLHAFGFKATGLTAVGEHLYSADSMAWSYAARRTAADAMCAPFHDHCSNCPRYAHAWVSNLKDRLSLSALAA
ncbi:DUF7221 family queuine tRNA-ribosyltransferase-like protein [Nocardiopsis alba]|uniref:deazapurine DNA modification protein DpdA family protein n=1 Tax=Nocardiopsis alba TaxID=53437 RepID=UPI0033A22332